MNRGDKSTHIRIEREPEVRNSRRLTHEKPIVITGGAGFIGSNLADRLLRDGHRVILFDNLSRLGVQRNVAWLRETHGEGVSMEVGDVCDAVAVHRAIQRASKVFHFAAQTAVTTSLIDPTSDFLVNARGTLNVLEAIRLSDDPPPLVFTSTNKVYGGLDDIPLVARDARYIPEDDRIAAKGIDESRPLDFHSPYGCSKGSADQYVRDYARSFGLDTVVFRMSCIYGPHQCGTEDQGWVAHFAMQAIAGEPITLYGDGKQVRDILFVEDLVEAFLLAQKHMPDLRGQAFNIGGGANNAASLVEILDLIGDLNGRRTDLAYEDWRTGDQRYYVSNTAKFSQATGWAPRVSVEDGVRRMFEWLRDNSDAALKARAHPRRPMLVDVAAPSGAIASEGGAA